MIITDAKESKDIDNLISKKYKIPSNIRMEVAGLEAFKLINSYFKPKRALIIIGTGNNGGDGLVLARYMFINNISCDIFMMENSKKTSVDFKNNKKIVEKLNINFVKSLNKNKISKYDLIVDAIFGIGLNRDIQIESPIYKIIKLINKSKKNICSLDCPSGLCSTTGKTLGISVLAELTITFDSLKTGLVIDPGYKCSKNIHVVNIGAPNEVFEKIKNTYLDDDEIKELIKPRSVSGNKGTFGHTLIIGGCKEMPGAVTIAALSAYKAGCGLVTICVPKAISRIVKSKVPEAIVIEMDVSDDGCYFNHINFIESLKNKLRKKPSAIVIGPGMGNKTHLKEIIVKTIKEFNSKFVLDADALNCLNKSIKDLRQYKRDIVITPHPGEMASVTGKTIKGIQENRIQNAELLAKKSNMIIVLKGFRTIISSVKDGTHINSSGSSAMATGGMGDSLSGIIGSFLAQGYKTIDATKIGVFLHGKSGDILLNKKHNRGILARDIIRVLPEAIHSFVKNSVLEVRNYIKNEN